MSGHSKFSNIKHKKEKNDAAKGKIFTKLGREIAVAVKEGGPDPNSNSKLKDVIAKCKSNNMPNDTIDRSIKKAAGDANSANYESITYEGYGPNGVAVIVKALTDNKNRTASNVRNAFTKGGGSMGVSGCVGFLFDELGLIIVERENCNFDSEDLMSIVIDAGANDFIEEDDSYEIYTSPEDFSKVRDLLDENNIIMSFAEVTMIPQTKVTLSDQTSVNGMNKMLDLLDDDDDVQEVYHNWNEEE